MAKEPLIKLTKPTKKGKGIVEINPKMDKPNKDCAESKTDVFETWLNEAKKPTKAAKEKDFKGHLKAKTGLKIADDGKTLVGHSSLEKHLAKLGKRIVIAKAKTPKEAEAPGEKTPEAGAGEAPAAKPRTKRVPLENKPKVSVNFGGVHSADKPVAAFQHPPIEADKATSVVSGIMRDRNYDHSAEIAGHMKHVLHHDLSINHANIGVGSRDSWDNILHGPHLARVAKQMTPDHWDEIAHMNNITGDIDSTRNRVKQTDEITRWFNHNPHLIPVLAAQKHHQDSATGANKNVMGSRHEEPVDEPFASHIQHGAVHRTAYRITHAIHDAYVHHDAMDQHEKDTPAPQSKVRSKFAQLLMRKESLDEGHAVLSQVDGTWGLEGEYPTHKAAKDKMGRVRRREDDDEVSKVLHVEIPEGKVADWSRMDISAFAKRYRDFQRGSTQTPIRKHMTEEINEDNRPAKPKIPSYLGDGPGTSTHLMDLFNRISTSNDESLKNEYISHYGPQSYRYMASNSSIGRAKIAGAIHRNDNGLPHSLHESSFQKIKDILRK